MTKCQCGLVWTSLTECHCAKCHRHFGGVAGFDMHRKGGECVDPATLLTEKGKPRLVYRTSGLSVTSSSGVTSTGGVLAWRAPSFKQATEGLTALSGYDLVGVA